MRSSARRLLGAICVTLGVLSPAVALAQTSAIAGTVKDTSGAVLPGVTVEVSSPALIEKTRSSVTDGSGQYKVDALRPGIYSVTFTLPGFNTVKRDNIELTSDFTAAINGEMKVGAVEETITVSAESPVVDVQNITARTVMTRDVLDAIPTGRNIQAIGIMIPGTAIAVGGGGALSRDVGGSGNLQQSPLQYRGSGDTVQTIEGLRLNNLCAQGQYSGVYWNDGSFQEISYVTGADSAEMGQGGMRVNMVPKDGGNQFHGTFFGNFAPNSWASDNCGRRRDRRLLPAPGALRRSDLQPEQQVEGRQPRRQDLGHQSQHRRADHEGPHLVQLHLSLLGGQQDRVDSFFDPTEPVPLHRRHQPPGHRRRPHPQLRGRVSAQLSQKDKISYYHDDQNKVRGHWGISATIRPRRRRFRRRRPASCRCRSGPARTRTAAVRRRLRRLRPGVPGELSAEVLARQPRSSPLRHATGKNCGAWNNPADHFSKLFTEQFAASYVTGSHSMRFGATISQAKWRLTQQYTRDVQPVTYNGVLPTATSPGQRHAAHPDRPPQLDQERQRRVRAGQVDDQARHDQRRRALGLVHQRGRSGNAAGRHVQPRVSYASARTARTTWRRAASDSVANWKDLSPRSASPTTCSARQDGDQGQRRPLRERRRPRGRQHTDNNNPENTVG
jgi:hypothetical protein